VALPQHVNKPSMKLCAERSDYRQNCDVPPKQTISGVYRLNYLISLIENRKFYINI
jgi:hypothetical protein